MSPAPEPRNVELSNESVGEGLGLEPDVPVKLDLSQRPEGKTLHNLGKEEVGHRGKLSLFGGWISIEFSSGANVVGRALAWMVVVGIAIGSGWAVDRLASSLMIGRWLTTLLVVATGASVLAAGGYYLEANVPSRGSRPAKVAGALLATLVVLGLGLVAGYAVFAPDTIPHMPPITGTLYKVQLDDTLSDIADRWGDKGGYEDLVRKNPHPLPSGTDLARNPDVIRPGDVLTDVDTPARHPTANRRSTVP